MKFCLPPHLRICFLALASLILLKAVVEVCGSEGWEAEPSFFYTESRESVRGS